MKRKNKKQQPRQMAISKKSHEVYSKSLYGLRKDLHEIKHDLEVIKIYLADNFKKNNRI